MSRVELTIRHLVVHGAGRFDSDAFSEALRREVAHRIGERASLDAVSRQFHHDGYVVRGTAPGLPHVTAMTGPREAPAARDLARRLIR